jgi:hypothetical protein
MSGEDTEFYRERALVETHLASTATDEAAAKLHAELAVHYMSKSEASRASGDCDQPAAVAKKAERPKLHLAWSKKGQ